MSLEIYLLGQFKLLANGTSIELPSRPAQSLLAYLVLNRGLAHRREKLASLLWGETSETNARAYLRQALWRIRKAFDTGALNWQDYFKSSDITVAFNPDSNYWLDAEALQKGLEDRPISQIIGDISLYRGELLPGFYDEWVLSVRERLQAAYSQKMGFLLDRLIESEQWNEVLKWGEEWIRLDFSPEPAYRALMIAHARLGNMGMAGAAYQRCVEALKRDLGLEPSAETTRLFKKLRGGEEAPASPAQPLPAKPNLRLPDFFETSPTVPVEKSVIVARQPELDQLAGFLALALQGQGRVVFVTGEAGSGKTTLVAEFARRAREDRPDLITVQGNCNAHTGIGDPYLPFREILELLSGNVEAFWSAGAITQEQARFLWRLIPGTVQALIEVGSDLIDTFVSGSALLERARNFEAAGAAGLSFLEAFMRQKTARVPGSSQQSDLFLQYCHVVQALARSNPLLLVVDDLQWADQGSINLLFQLGRNLTGSRILVVGAYRPEEIALGRGGARHPLEPVLNELQRIFGDVSVSVDSGSSPAFIDALLDSEPNHLEQGFRELLYQQTGGQPLFTVELLRGMQERGDLRLDPHVHWVAIPSLNWELLPARVEAVLAERIDRLDQPLQAFLRAASVEGEFFTAEVIVGVLTRDPGEARLFLSRDLDRRHHLVRAQSIHREGSQLVSSYRFRHILVQRYLYNSLDEVEKVSLHERVGSALEEMYPSPERRFSIAPQLARHFQEARITEKAITYRQLAGERALVLSAYKEAIAHLTAGLELLRTEIPGLKEHLEQELSLQFALGKAFEGDFGNPSPEIERALQRSRELSQKVGRTSALCLAMSGLSIVRYVRGEFQEALKLAEHALQRSEQVEEPRLEAIIHWNLGIVHYVLGNYTLSRVHIQQTTISYSPEVHHHEFVSLRGVDAGASAMAYEACLLWVLGFPDQAVSRSQKALESARRYHHAFSLADVLSYAGCQLSKLQRDAHSLKEYAEEMIRLSQDRSLSGWLPPAIGSKGEALVMLGQLEQGIERLEDSLNSNLSMGLLLHAPRSMIALAEAHTRLGSLAEAWSWLAKAEECLKQSGEHHWLSPFYRARAALHTLDGNLNKAKEDLEIALAVARQQEARSWELQAAIDLARLFQAQGRLEEARSLLSGVFSWFTEGFGTPDLLNASTLLAALT